MARVSAVTTKTAIASSWANALQADYLSQTDTSDQTVASRVGRTITATTLGAGVTTFACVGTAMTITGDALGNTIATITSGKTGQILILLFVDANVTITDNNAHTANTVDLSAAFVSADDTTLTLYFDGTSWYELSRSVN